MPHTTYVYRRSLTFQQEVEEVAPISPQPRSITVTTCHLNLKSQGTAIQSCELTVEVSPENYQDLTQQEWFGFDPELCSQPTGSDFNDVDPFSLTLMLNPEWLAFLEIQKLRTAQAVGDYLLSLNALELDEWTGDDFDEWPDDGGDRPASPPKRHRLNRQVCALLNADNWFLLKVQQQGAQGTSQFRTFYDYLDWQAIATTDDPDALFTHTLAEFLKSTPIIDRIRTELSQSLHASNPAWTPTTVTHLSTVLLQAIPRLLRQDVSVGETLAKAFGEVFQRSLHHQFTTAIQEGTLLPPSWAKQLNQQDTSPDDATDRDEDEAIALAVATSLEQLFHQETLNRQAWHTLFGYSPLDNNRFGNKSLDQSRLGYNAKQSPGFTNNPSVLDMAIAFFNSESWPFEQMQTDNGPVLRLMASGKNGQWTCLVPIQEEPAQILFLSMFNPLIPEQDRDRIAKYLMSINYELTFGNFELDFTDGEVRFRTTLNLIGIDFQTSSIHALVKHLVYANIATMDTHWQDLSQWINSDLLSLSGDVSHHS